MVPCTFTSPSTLQTVGQLSPAVILSYQIMCLVQQALLLATLIRVTAARHHLLPWLLQTVPRGPCRVSQPVNLRATPWPVIQAGALPPGNCLDTLESKKGGAARM